MWLQSCWPLWMMLQSWRHKVPTLCRVNPTEYHRALVIITQALPSWWQGGTESLLLLLVSCRGCLRLQSTAPVKGATAFGESYLFLTVAHISPSWTKELVCLSSRSVWPVSNGTETDQRNKRSDNTSEETGTPSKRGEMGRQGMVDTVSGEVTVPACPDWGRIVRSEAQWAAKNAGSALRGFYLSRYKEFMSFKVITCLGKSCRLGERAFCLLLTDFCVWGTVSKDVLLLLFWIIGIHAQKVYMPRYRETTAVQPDDVQTDSERVSYEFQRALDLVFCELHQKCSLGQ